MAKGQLLAGELMKLGHVEKVSMNVPGVVGRVWDKGWGWGLAFSHIRVKGRTLEVHPGFQWCYKNIFIKQDYRYMLFDSG